jgi:hypothetical protein
VNVAGLGQRERQIVLDVQTSEGVVLLARDSQIDLVVRQQESKKPIVRMGSGPTQTTRLVMSVPPKALDVVVLLTNLVKS